MNLSMKSFHASSEATAPIASFRAPTLDLPAVSSIVKEHQKMSSSSLRSSANSCAPALLRLFAASLAILVTLTLASTGAFAQCTLSSPDTWSHGANGNWNVAGNWSSGIPNSSSTNTCITDGSSTVTLNINATVADLQLASGNALDFNGNTQLSVYGSQILNAGQININGGGNTNSYLYLPGGGTTTLSGGGSVTLNTTTTGGGGNANLYLQNGSTLDNVDNAIQGEGIIYNNGTTVNNDAGGVINANSTGSPLISTLSLEYGTVNNAGLLEATSSGNLLLYNTTVNNAGGNITANGAGASVSIQSTSIVGGTLNSVAGGFIGTPTSTSATLDGSTGAGAVTVNGTYTVATNSQTSIYGSIVNNGNFQINGGGNTNSYLYVPGNVSLTGGGTVSLSTTTTGGGGNAYLWLNNASIMDNISNTIQGEGIIYNNGTTFNNHTGGVVNANSAGSPLISTLSLEYGTFNNAGLLEATSSGDLQLYTTTVNNAGGNITASGSGATVDVLGSTIVSGTLNNNGGAFFGSPTGYNGTLDGSTGAGAVTLNGTYTTAPNAATYLHGSIVNKGNFQVNGGGNSNTYLYIPAAVTLTGGGTVSLSTSTNGGGGNANLYLYNGITLDNVNNTIQGEGIIYNNGTIFNNHAAGVINANFASGLLINYLELEYGVFNNTGLMEATNNGNLQLYSTTVNNAGGGVISANGSGASVTLFGTTIQSGTLNDNGSAFLGTPSAYSAYLDGSTGAGPITLNGTYTSDFNSNTYLYGSIINNNNLLVNGGNNTNTYLYDTTAVTLSGGGTVSLHTDRTGGGGFANLYLTGSTTLDNVNNTIQGEGVIYNNGAIFNNHAAGIINANSAGSPLINTLELYYGTFNNNGLMEATNNGNLQLYSTIVNNTGGGVVSANGPGASVTLYATTIQGGSLNNNGGAFLGTASGYSAYLDGSTTAGAVTLIGTYTGDYNSNTYLYGTINNQGNLLVNGGNNNNTYLWNNTGGTVTLTGGGTVSLRDDRSGGGGDAWLYLSGGSTLDNTNNTIQGEGLIYINGATLVNEAGGTILANSAGGTLINSLTVDYGTVTNYGTMQADAGNLLHMFQGNLTNFSGNTLTGGTYNVYGTTSNPGTLQIDAFGNTGGEIHNNAATILLNGPNSNIYDQAGLNALSNFNNNTAAGSFTIQNGRNFTSPGVFSNAGAVNIGSGSTFSTASGSYNQSGGNTKVDGALAPAGGLVSISGGTLSGNGGTVTGNVNLGGTMSPGDGPAMAGKLNVVGNYIQTSGGIFQLDLGGLTAGSQFDWLDVSGTTSLSGTLDVSLINAFFPNVGDTFTFLTSGGAVSGIFGTVNGLNIGGGEVLQVVYNANNVQITTLSLAPTNDYWNGGTGVWSNGGQWSLGTSPGSNNNAYIYSGGNDLVTLDVGTGTVNQLNLGGASNGFTSELKDNGTAQNLTILQGLSIGANGFLQLTGASTISAASMANNGHVYLGTGASLLLTNQLGGITDAVAGSTFDLYGTFTDVVGSANGFANLNSIEGTVNLFGQNFTDTPGSGTLTISSTGALAANSGTTLKIAGNVDNSGTLSTDPGGNILTITGSVTNNASGLFQLNGPGDTATTGAVTNAGNIGVNNGSMLTINTSMGNSGTIDLENGSTLQVNGGANNSGNLYTSFYGGSGGNTLTFTGTVANQASGQFVLDGPSDKATMAGLGNSGYVDVEGGSTFQVNGNATNSGNIYTSYNGTGGNTFNVTGTFTNTNFVGLESTDTATIGGAVNNSGSFQMTGGSNATFTSALTNTGTLDLENASTLHVNGTADNFGTLSTSANGGTGGNTVTVAGLLTNEAGAQVNVNGPGDHLTASGGMVNKGTVTVSNGSTIDPPYLNNLGTLNIDGTSTFVVGTGNTAGTGFIQLPNGTYGEMINSATAFGVVDVSGSAILDGTLDIMLQTGYNPAIGTSFTFLLTNPGQLSGTYANILGLIFNGGTEKWLISYNYGAGYAQLTAASNNSPVPEPGTFLMLGSALIGVAYSARRRFKK
jgi:PEP-CTERM motif